MSYLLDSVPNQILQQRKLKREKKHRQDRDQPLEEHVKVPLCDKSYDHMDQGESGGKRRYSPELVLKKQAVKCKRFGETNKTVSEQPYSKLRQENSSGGAVKVQGSRVVQLIGQKERHNKVSTTRGPRDRRVRLAAHTAIQFYDVQDRLGYDQPSKAIDWLIEKAKAAIEELSSQNHESVGTNNNSVTQTELELREERTYQLQHCQGCDMGNHHPLNKTSMNNESIFSVVAGTQPCSSQFQDYLTEKNLQCSKAPDFDVLYSSAIDFAEDELNSAAILSELNSTDMGGRFQSLTALNSCSVNGGEEFVQNSLPALLQQPLLCENQVYSQWGPLQSSNLFSVHSSTTPPICVNGHAHMQSSNSHLFSTKGFSSGGFFGI